MPLFPFAVYAAALAGGFLTVLLLMPGLRVLADRLGLVDDPGHRKIHAAPTPLAGGLAVACGLLLPMVGAALLLILGFWPGGTAEPFMHGLGRKGWELLVIQAGAVLLLLLGILDDRFELPPATKFAGQVAIAALVAIGGIRVTLFVPDPLFHILITMLWILTVVNAMNFMDNMNGLCGGLGAIAAWAIAWTSATKGQYLVASYAFLVAGGLVGFLVFNFPKASVFLGDSGSHLVGYLVAILSILPHFHSSLSPQPLAVLSPLLILFVPLADMAIVVVLRWRLGKPFYVGDTNHLSHRLVRAGLSRTTAVLLIWLIAALAGALAVVLAT